MGGKEREGTGGKEREGTGGKERERERKYRHKLAILRPELMDTFLQYRYLVFLKLAKEKASKLPVIQDLLKDLAEKETGPKGHSQVKQPETSSATPTGGVYNSGTGSGQDSSRSRSEGESGQGESRPGTESRQVVAPCGGPSPAGQDAGGGRPDSTLPSPDSKLDSILSRSCSTPKTMADLSIPRLRPVGTGCSHMTIFGGRGAQEVTVAGLERGAGEGKEGKKEGDEEEEEEREGGESQQALSLASSGSGDVLLVDGLHLLVEKELKPDDLPGARDLPAPINPSPSSSSSSSTSSSAVEELERTWTTSGVLKSHPEVMAALQEAAREAGSVGGEEFDIQFNVDILSPGLTHADPPEVLERDRTLLREAALFLTHLIIPQLVRDCVQLTLTPVDGRSLVTAMHARGINMRYLGRVAQLASGRDDLHHLKRLCVGQMVVRAAKRKLRLLLQETPYERVSEAITQFLNCFLGGQEGGAEEAAMVNGHHSKKKQKKKKVSKGFHSPTPHLRLSPGGVWSDVMKELREYYRYSAEHTSVHEMCSELGLDKTSLLRELCKKAGIQMVAQDYNFSSRTPFTQEDIASLYPIVKHTHFKSAESCILFELAQSKFKSGYFRTAHNLYMEALQMFIQIFGPLHLDVANCYRQVAKIHYVVGEPLVALSYQHKAALVYERVLGVDHADTISAYINLAIYCHNSNQTTVALRLMFRARYLLLVMCGEDHPEVATCDCNIALMLHSIKLYDRSLQFLENSLKVFEKYHGKLSLQAALTHHLIARVQSFLGDFRTALLHEKITYTIYKNKYGTEHERTKESSSRLQELTEKAVVMQKTINEMTGKGSAGKVLFDLPGSWGDVANLINAPDSAPRHLPRGQKPSHTKTHVVRRRARPSKQPQSTATKPGDKAPSSQPE